MQQSKAKTKEIYRPTGRYGDPLHRIVMAVFAALSLMGGLSAGRALGDDLPAAVRSALSDHVWLTKQYAAAVTEFYATRGHQPIWVDQRGLTPRGVELARTLKTAQRDGLDPARYLVGVRRRRGATPLARAAGLEIAMSEAMLIYASDLRLGSTRPRVTYVGIAPPVRDRPVAVLLGQAAGAESIGRFLASLAPSNPMYVRLRAALGHYRAIRDRGGWTRIGKGPRLKIGLENPRMLALRHRLAMTGDLRSDASSSSVVDVAVLNGLRRFQSRHGLDPTGTLNRATLLTLNLPVNRRVETIILNLERLRWIPQSVVQRSVLVNAAAFRLDVIEAGRSRLNTRVIVGKCTQRTPQFVTMMTGVQFNPYWRIPKSIARYEILPRLRRDPGYLRRQRIKVLADWGGAVLDPRRIDWKALKGMPYKLRQEPGPGNALGRIRFLMPNPFNVFLHDTPTKRLFKRSRRAFSHGCIRVQNPDRLAAHLLRHQPGWNLAAVRKAARGRVQRRVVFSQPLPVYIGYFTAWVDETNTVQFRDDLYRRDRSLAAAQKARRR